MMCGYCDEPVCYMQSLFDKLSDIQLASLLLVLCPYYPCKPQQIAGAVKTGVSRFLSCLMWFTVSDADESTDD